MRNVAILVFDDVEVLDFAGPFEVFNVASEVIKSEPVPPFFTYTVAPTEHSIVARGGLRIQPHCSFDNCPDPDILIVPGGFGSRRLMKNDYVLTWIQQLAPEVEYLLSVCTGALVLGAAGLLQDRPATTHHDAFGLLRSISPTTTLIDDQRFVKSGKIITSGGISAGIDLSLEVVEMVLGADKARLVHDEMEWMWHS
ncbi:MAG: DJ-1/PfpI family protein [Anaerolineae bacterium]|nr:DJ-1/PfpI family protein [Anaerolineae bacterium]